MLTIGLTGPSGAGKGVVASLFAEYGVPSIDTDAVYHDLLIPPSVCLDELAERFGPTILTPDGRLDRRILASLVFGAGHEAELTDLNRITHRHVLDKVRLLLTEYKAAGISAVLVDAPQLYESGFDTECDYVVAVLAPRDTRLARIMARDGLDEARAAARIDAQKSDEFFRSHAHAVLMNQGAIEALEAEIRNLLVRWEVLP